MAVISLDESPKMFGAYVETISASIGWGGQGGSCQMTLVEDPENGVTISLPEVGTASYFKYRAFYYGGIFQRWAYKESISGRKYDIVLESPGGKVLDGVHAILSNFEGTAFNEGAGYNKFSPSGNPNLTTQVNNVWNPYGHKENYSFGGRFGLADTNSAGFPARSLLDLLELISQGGSDFGGPIYYGESTYELDLTEIKTVPEYFRIGGQSATLNSIVQECTEILQYDYFADVRPKSGIPTVDGGGTIDDPVIKIRTIDKTQQPNAGAVRTLVENAKTSGDLVSSDVGQELSDETTQRVVVGGPASRYYVARATDCYPVWGKSAAGTYILGTSYGWNPNVPNVPQGYQLGAKVKVLLDEYNPFGAVHDATVAEIRMATAGFESWQTFKVFESVANGTYQDDPWVAGLDVDVNELILLSTGQRGALSLASTSIASAQKVYDEDKKEYTKRIFDKVNKVAQEFYGRYFLVPLPAEPGGLANNLKFIREDVQEISAWDINDTAWTTEKPVSDVAFYNSDGRLKSLSVYPIADKFDYSEMGGDYSIWKSTQTGFGLATTKSGPHEPNVFYINQWPYIVVDTAVQIKEWDLNTTPDFGITFLANYFFNVNIPPANYISAGKQNTQIMVPPAVTYPDLIGVPQESVRYSWGPWYNQSHSKGKAEVVFDTSLRPETFGSVSGMNQAGTDVAGSGNSVLAASETGRVELARFPEWNIADRFAGIGPYVTNMNISVNTGGITTSYQFNTWTPNFGKLTKYNADRVSRIYKGTLSALQKIREDNPKRAFKPFRFTKTDFEKIAERLKTNRTSGEFGLMRMFSTNNHAEGSQITLADAAAMSIQHLSASYGCSEDQKWSPVGTRKTKVNTDDGTYFSLPVELDEETGGKFAAGAGPSSRDLDPYFSEFVYGDAATMIANTDFVAAVNAVEGETTDLALRKAGNVDEIRSVGLRLPMIASGWGFDIAANPAPGDDNDVTSFSSNMTRQNWKTGPVNLLWDEERKIWTGGLEIVCGVLASDITAPSDPLTPTTFDIDVLRKTNEPSSKGSGAWADSSENITCYNRDPSLSQSAGTNVFVMAIRINYEWIPLWVGCP